MQYWYAPSEVSQFNLSSGLPPELIAAVAAPWRSTNELEAIRAKARSLSHYDMAGVAHDLLNARKKQESKGAVRALRRGQLMDQLQTDKAALEALNAVDHMWTVHLEQLQKEASKAVRSLQEKHEESLTRMRLQQVAKANDSGIRPERRSKELLNLRRSESVLVSRDNYHAASKVKAHADGLAVSEACSAHVSWLLRCHGEQERLLARQRRELEALQKRLDERLKDVEAARDRDLEKLQRKIKANSSQQQRGFARERRFLGQALQGDMLDTTTTRRGHGLADALPTFAQMAAPKQPPDQRSARSIASSAGPPSMRGPSEPSGPGTGYLGPSRGTGGAGRVRSEGPAGDLGVRFAPTPPRREAWGAAGKGASTGSGSGSGKEDGISGRGREQENSNGSGDAGGAGQPRPSSGSGDSGGVRSDKGPGSVDEEPSPRSRPESAQAYGRQANADEAAASEPAQGAAPSTAVGSGGTPGNKSGSGSSALTEAALRAMNRAAGAPQKDGQRGASSLQSSSFKSNRPYIVGRSARALAKPVSAAV